MSFIFLVVNFACLTSPAVLEMDEAERRTNVQNYVPGGFNPLSSEVTELIKKTVSSVFCTCNDGGGTYVKSSSDDADGQDRSVVCVSSCDVDRILTVLSLPPRFTTIRVNLLRTTPSDAVKLIQDELKRQYVGKTAPLPLVYQHHSLPEVVVVEAAGVQTAQPVTKEVIVGGKCGSAVLRGAQVYAPGVVGASPDLKPGDPVAVYVDLHDVCLRGCKFFGGQKMFIGNGTADQGRKELFNVSKPSGVAVSMKEQVFDSPSLGNFYPDLFFLQNLPSVLCGHILSPSKHATVLDMCAAPGGKTTHIASLLCNMGQVIAIDRSQSKIDQIVSNAAHLGLSNITTCVYDSTKLISEVGAAEEDAELTGKGLWYENSSTSDSSTLYAEFSTEQKFKLFSPPYKCSSFRWILLDAPCSALGQRPQVQSKMSIKELNSFPAIQRKLLRTAVRLLEPGGVLVYSTCTIVVEENEAMVKWVLDKFTDVQLINTSPRLGRPGLSYCGLDDKQVKMVQRFGPLPYMNQNVADVDEDTIGFFIAAFKKLS